MRTLLLLRHGKSSWDCPSLDDFDRPLARRGERAAIDMADHLAREGLDPDFVLCSAARRAVDTWRVLAQALAGPKDVRVLRGLYHAPAATLLAALQGAPDEARSVLLVGHNPGLQGLALGLAGTASDPAALGRLETKFPTAALAQFVLDVPGWSDVGEGTARLTRFVTPRELAPASDQAEVQNGSARR